MSLNCKKIKIGNIEKANNLPLVLIAGPCQMESKSHAFAMVEEIGNISSKLGMPFIYKTSFDKANRTSLAAERGLGLEKAMDVFAAIKEKFGCPILTDVHTQEQCKVVADVVDILQIPAFLCRQTDLIVAAAETGKVVNIKKGQFLAPHDMTNVCQKSVAAGNDQILLTERGTCFGYNALVNDMRGLEVMKNTSYPVIFDATHSVQQPGGLGSQSGGQREFIKPLARAAVAVGIAGLFIETHQEPDKAPSDGMCMLPLQELPQLLTEVKAFDEVAKRF
jgi:2-dehydro-3-deoxyphosphooctonate aldolase (KDO 8-P synthase)